MKRFYIDTNVIVSKKVVGAIKNKNINDELILIEEVMDELNEDTKSSLLDMDISFPVTDFRHLDELQRLMSNRDVCNNFDLIELFNNKGMADVLILAHVISEKTESDQGIPFNESEFIPSYIIVTLDKGLVSAAEKNGILTMSKDEFINLLQN